MTAPAASWPMQCPVCASALGELPDADALIYAIACASCGTSFARRDGVWDMLAPDRVAHFGAFLGDYTKIRHAEGRGSDDPAHYRALPSVRGDDPLAWQWGIRARTWRHVRRTVLPRLARRHPWRRKRSLRVVDVGAGVGWLSNRLRELGHRPIAIDLTLDARDGLGAVAHYEDSFPAVRAEFDRLPLADASADLVVFNASLHYSTDYETTLREATRVLAPGGRIVVLESPVYRRDESGRQMVAERHADFATRFGTRSDAIASIEYLTSNALAHVGSKVGLRWQHSKPWYGVQWALRPWRARVHKRRESSRFLVLLAHRRDERVRPVRDWGRRMRRGLATVTALAVFAGGAEATYLWYQFNQIERVHVEGLGVRPPATTPTTTVVDAAASVAVAPAVTIVPVPVDDAMNILLVGVDSAEGLAGDDRVRIGRTDGDRRTDTIMVIRLDPRRDSASVLSIPRDLWVPLGGDGAPDKINAAFVLGGPDLLVRTVANNLGITIDHYAEIDFAQFQRIVDVVDGVPMSFNAPVQDKNSGLYIGEPACVNLKGAQALAFVRSRHLEVMVDGVWVADRSADLSRIRRQQDFIRRALSRATAVRNPLAFNQLVDRGVASVTIDDGLGTGDLLRLARTFRSFDSNALLTSALPVVVGTSPNGLSIVRLVSEEAEPWLDLYRGIDPDSPGNVVVDVRGANATAAVASLVASGVQARVADGVDVARTTIRYRSLDRYRAELLARYVAADVALVVDDSLDAPGVVLTLAVDSAIRATPAPGVSYKVPPERTQVGVLPSEGGDLCN